MRLLATVSCLALAFASLSCSEARPTPPACADQACRDDITVRALRETTKLAYNLTLQGKPVGAHDRRVPCLKGGAVRVVGTATSNPLQGTTEVDLAFEFTGCGYLQKDSDPNESFELSFTGRVLEKGVLAVQPGATSAVALTSDALRFSGTVSDPPVAVGDETCAVDLVQNGARLGGSLCARTVGGRL